MTHIADPTPQLDPSSDRDRSVPFLTLVTDEPAPPPAQVVHLSRADSQSARARRLAQETHRRFVAAAGADEHRRLELLDEVVTTHLWLAETLARRFQNRGEEEQDLLQVARAGLVGASRRFDVERGPFLSFAVPTVTGVLRRHFRDLGWSVRPPRRIQDLAFEIRREWPALVQSLGAIPTETHLAAHLGASVDEVREARRASQGYSCTLLDTSPQGDGEVEHASVETERLETRLLLAKVWPLLELAEHDLIHLRFYQELSQSRIATLLGTSQMQVSRDLARLFDKLRSLIGTEGGSIAC